MTLSEEKLFKSHIPPHHCFNADVSTNSIAEMMENLVCDRYAQKLAEKLVHSNTRSFIDDQGKLAAKMIVRKHRLWVTFG
jgi:DtxR family Mn-dependent transcriptional regulator